MFGMNGFHVSASGAIQGHHCPHVLLPTVFSTQLENFLPFSSSMKLSSASSLSLEASKICCLGEGLKGKVLPQGIHQRYRQTEQKLDNPDISIRGLENGGKKCWFHNIIRPKKIV